MEEEIWRILQAGGYRRTEARGRILHRLLQDRRWRTPQEFGELLREEGEEVGLTTVYRFLELLEREGLGWAHRLPNGTVRYAFCSPGHHHHAICLACGQVEEIACADSPVTPPGFRPTDHQVQIYGYCRDCGDSHNA